MTDKKGADKIKQVKLETVASIKQKLDKAKVVFLTEYRGLTHQQMEALRKRLKKTKAEFLVAKNTFMKIALKEWNKDKATSFEPELNNPTATLFGYEDEMAPVKEMSLFIKNNQPPKVKIGIFGGKIATAADFDKLATMPGKDVLLATLAMRMKSPIYGLHYALNWNLNRLVTVLNNVKGKIG